MNEIDEKDKTLVSGYCHECADSLEAVVPDLVFYTIISFYYYVLFGDHHPCFRLSAPNNSTITKIDDHGSWKASAYQ